MRPTRLPSRSIRASSRVDDLVATVAAAGYGAALEDADDRPHRRGGRRPAPARRRSRSERATRPGRHDRAAPVRRLGVGRLRARDTRRPLGRLAVPSRRVAECASRSRDDGHARLGRHARRLGLVDGRAPRGSRCGDVLRGRRRDHDADPDRPLPRSARPPPLGRGDPRPARARREGGSRAARRSEVLVPDRGARGRRPLRRAPGREDRDRRRRRRGGLRGRPVDAHRRAGAGGSGRGGIGRGRDDQHLRPPRRRGDEGRRRHRARADRPSRRRGTGRARRRSSGSSTASRRSSSRS